MGSSKKATVGHKYSMGQHCDLVHGPIDHISRISFDTDRVAWRGRNSGGTITVSAESLFGGDDGRGGVSGQIDLMMGKPDQQKNNYLMSQLGSLIPAFRGVVTAVFKQFYFGNSEFLAPVSFRGTRTMVRDDDGKPQWYLPKASIFSGNLDQPHAIYIALDTSGSMDNVGGGSLFENMYSNGNTRLQNAKLAINATLDFIKGALVEFPLDIRVVGWSTSAASITRRSVDQSDIDDLKAWVSGRTASGNTDFRQGVNSLNSFFSSVPEDAVKVAFFITDGIPEVSGMTPEANAAAAGAIVGAQTVPVHAINIDLPDTQYTEVVDNTPEDGVPVISGGLPEALVQVLMSALDLQIDQNPAHILRETDNSQIFGLSLPDADIDDDAFMAAADRLYEEGMGISLLWDSESMTLEDFQGEITRHIDANHFIDNKTGLATIKLIRDDYDIETLPVLDASSVIRVERAASTPVSELVNAVTVVYWDPVTGKDASVQVSDPALVQMQGRIKSTTVQYPGFTNANIATRAAMRDLRSLSNSLFTCTLIVNRVPEELNNGSAFILVWPELKQFGTVMRIADIDWGDGRNNDIRITCTQDVFALPDTPVMATSPGAAWEDPRKPPQVPADRLVIELPYYELVQSQGQSVVDAALAETPELGGVGVAASRPSGNAINAEVYTEAGGGFASVGYLDFCPTAKLAANIDLNDDTFALNDPSDLDQVEVNSIAQVGDELLGVVALDTTLNIVTVKRAVLDSPLTVHSNGDTIYFWDQALFNDPTEYVDGETINAKVLTITGGGQLSLASAPTDSIEMDARAIRPLPPGQFKINDQYFPMAISGDVTASWSERNRLQQTGGLPLGFYDNGVTPEAGTTYTVRAFNSSTDELLHETTGITTTSHVIPSADLAGAIDVLVTVHAVRDGYESYVPRSHTFEYSAALNVMQFADGYTPPAGDGVVMEFTGYPAGVPYLHFERLQDAGASQPQQIELSISNANPDGETYNLAIGQDYTLTLGGANFEYTPIPLAADHYLNTVLDDSPAYLFSLRPDDVDEFGSGTTVSGYINFGSVSGACGVVTAQGSINFTDGEALITDAGETLYIDALDSGGGSLRVRFANGVDSNDSNAIKGAGNFSVEMWFKTFGLLLGGTKVLFAQDGDGTYTDQKIFLTFNPTDDSITFTINGGIGAGAGHFVSGTAEISDGLAHHIVVTRGANDKLSIYVDGALVAQDTHDSSLAIDDTFTIAQWGTGITTTAQLSFALDHAAIYDYELSAGDIVAHYAAGTASNPFAHIPFFTPVFQALADDVIATGNYTVDFTTEPRSESDPKLEITAMKITHVSDDTPFSYDASVD